ASRRGARASLHARSWRPPDVVMVIVKAPSVLHTASAFSCGSISSMALLLRPGRPPPCWARAAHHHAGALLSLLRPASLSGVRVPSSHHAAPPSRGRAFVTVEG